MHDKIEGFWGEFDKYTVAASRGGVPMLFRGEPQDGNDLIPSIGRDTKVNTNGDIETIEDDLMNEFKRLAIPVLKQPPSSDDDFGWLFLAQHYGLPTRLLDWTTNPLVALFFTVEKDDGDDAAIYIVNHPISDQYVLFDYRTADVKSEKKNGILSVIALQPGQKDVIFIRPKYTDQRYINQKSVFSCHSDPFKSLCMPDQVKLVVKKEWKHGIRDQLRVIGVTHSYIYPGLEGVAREVKAASFDPVKAGRKKIFSGKACLHLPICK